MITTRDLTKTYGRITAVDGVDLSVAEGDRYGLLGPNGSGKTTLVRMLLGLVFATRGEIEVLGRPVPQAGQGGAGLGRRDGRRTRRVPAPVRADQPAPAGRGRPGRRPPRPQRPDRRRAGAGRSFRCRPAAGPRVLPGYASAPRPGRGAAAQAPPARPGRADQRPGPARHPGDPRPAHRAERGRHDGVPVQPSAVRDRSVLHSCRGDGPWPAGAAGAARRPARADRPGAAQLAGTGSGGRAAGRPGGGPRRAVADRAPRRIRRT